MPSVQPQPTPDTAADYLAQWMMVNEPALFNALLARTPQSLNGIGDILSNIAGGVTTAAKNVGSFLASKDGMEALAGLSTVYLQSRMQKDALAVQVKLAQAGQPPAPIQTAQTTSGQIGAFYYPPNSAPIPVTPSVAQQLMPPREVWPWALGGGFLFLGLLFALRR